MWNFELIRMDKETILEKIQAIQDKHSGTKGQNDYDLFVREEVADLFESYAQMRIEEKEKNLLPDGIDIIIPDVKTEKNIILSRAMTWISEDAQEMPEVKDIFDGLASLMDREQTKQLCDCYDSHESNEVEILEICCRCRKLTK